MDESKPETRVPPTIRAVQDSRTIPPVGRTVCVLLDGTGDMFDDDNSNIVKLFQALRKDHPGQICYYQTGVGTYTSSAKGTLKTGLSAALDMAVGASLGTHVRDAYSFLMQTYQEGDRINIFGFSRGAYAARALSGMLHKVGLLPAHNQAQLPFAYKWYKNDTAYGWEMSAEFKRTFGIDVQVQFLGCWDAVSSVGVIPRILPFAKAHNTAVRHFRHALALDEHRAKFKANHWYQRHPVTAKEQQRDEEMRKIEAIHNARTLGSGRGTYNKKATTKYGAFGDFDLEAIDESADQLFRDSGMPLPHFQDSAAHEQPEANDLQSKTMHSQSLVRSLSELQRPPSEHISSGPTLRTFEGRRTSDEIKGRSLKQVELMNKFNARDAEEWGRTTEETSVLEVWFAGTHADVGGGAVHNDERHMISRVPLRWMIRETFKCNTGILYRSDVLAEHGMDVHTLHPKLIERKPPVVGPAPSDVDRYTAGQLPSLESRRRSLRSHNIDVKAKVERTEGKSDVAPAQKDEQLARRPPDEDIDVLPEIYEDFFDAQAPINDQLKQSKVWWILEFWPIKYRVKQEDGTWKKKVGINLGRYRAVRDSRPKMHWTVAQRLQSQKDYKIQCSLPDDCIWDIVL